MKRMKLVVVLVIVGALAVTGIAYGQAYNTSFTTSITYQNVGTGEANIVFEFYPEDNATPVTVNKTLAAGAGSSLYIGTVSEISSGFNGSAVMSSDEPVVATMVQVPNSSTVKNRPLSNGFSADQGANEYLIATVLKNQFNSTSKFAVQNVDSGNVDLTVNFYAVGSSTPTHTATHNDLPPGAAKYFDAGQISQLGSSFNGSAVIEATGTVVASALELSTTSTGASSFEGVATGAQTVYMASALCNAFGGQHSAYAVQNTGTSATNVTVNYNGGGSETKSIAGGAKESFIGCDANSAGYSGSATISSDSEDIVAIGKVYGKGLSTAFLGDPAGASKLALPYVRWSESQYVPDGRQRAFIAIQNVGGALNAGDVTVSYRDKNGNEVGTHSLPAIGPSEKVNSYAVHPDVTGNSSVLNEFGYYSDGTFGGSVIVEGPAGSQLVAVVRVQSRTSSGEVGEDYNGIAID